MTLFDLTGKVALLTGASKGMGLAMAKALAEHGATVVISARKQDQLDAAAAEINALGKGKAFGVACNVGYKEQLQALVDETPKRPARSYRIGNAVVNPYYGPTLRNSRRGPIQRRLNAMRLSNLWLAQMVRARHDRKRVWLDGDPPSSIGGVLKPSVMLGNLWLCPSWR
ncbi:SDR family NAD(P)-dependent oxidoreductase [Sulfitobacter sp. M13]